MKFIFYKILLIFFIFVSLIAQEVKVEIDSTQTAVLDSTKITLTKTVQSENHNSNKGILYATVQNDISKPLRVRVLYDGVKPVEKFPVYFEVISFPPKSKDFKIYTPIAYTDVNGYAQTKIKLGSVEGDYEFSARINIDTERNDIVYFKAFARKADWVFFLVTGLVGGLALFLFGMDMMSEGMKKTAGGKLRLILETLTTNRILAVAVGTFVTMVLQSSSATTVMLVSFVQAQLMTFAQTVGIILGAGIGTTITAQLIAFKLTDYSLLVIGFGFLIIYLSKTKKIKHIGEFVLGFGLLFFGMYIMSDSMYPLRTYDPFISLLLHLENPVFGILVGTIFTALIQSSAAFMGIIIVLGSQGLITLEAAIPLILGTNIGTSITAILASLKTRRPAKRVALAHTLSKVFGVLLFIWWIPYFAEIVRIVSPHATATNGFDSLSDVLPRQIANAHTIYNIILTLILLPFTKVGANLIEKLLPDVPEEDESVYKVKYLEDSLISTPTLALNLAKAEIIRMIVKVQKMVEQIIVPFFKNDEDILEQILTEEAEINYLNFKISNYLMKISQKDLEEDRANEVYQMMHCITEIEQIGDNVSKMLVPLARKRINQNLSFSEEGKREIEDYHLRTMKQISRAIEVFKDVNLQSAKRMEKKYKKYRLMELELRRTHFDRLREQIPQSVETSGMHLELIDWLKRIASNATNIARIFLETKHDKENNSKQKANSIKEENNNEDLSYPT